MTLGFDQIIIQTGGRLGKFDVACPICSAFAPGRSQASGSAAVISCRPLI
jgi:hypothetical protein